MTAWWEKALRGLTLVALAAFTLAAIGHIVAMWFLRKHFAIALRWGFRRDRSEPKHPFCSHWDKFFGLTHRVHEALT